MVKRAKLRRVLKRDNWICGLHLGGCCKPIIKGEPYNLDHIIPKALFSRVAQERNAEFNMDWNLQPMHLSCNNASKGSSLDGWPHFICKCHYLQLWEGDLYVCTKGAVGKGKHRLLENIVSECRDRVDARIVIGSGKGKGGTNQVGYWKDKFGYLMPGIAASRVEMFNLTESGRVGLSVPRFIRIDEKGRIVGKWGST